MYASIRGNTVEVPVPRGAMSTTVLVNRAGSRVYKWVMHLAGPAP